MKKITTNLWIIRLCRHWVPIYANQCPQCKAARKD